LVSITPSPVLSFIKRDSLLCPGKTITLNALTGFINYQWQDGTSGGTYVITKPGLYKVTATNYCGNISSDSILVTNSDTSLNIISSQTICLYDTAFIVLPNDVTNVLWQPNTNSLLNNKTLSLYPQQNTVYTINAERMPNCTLTKQTAVVIKVCPQTFFIPNSFTPNNDNRNDVFKPSVSLPLAFYHMQIFNRYGQNVFETSNQYNGWDGMYKGRRQPIEGYIYQCSYRFNNATQKIINGYFILLR
jgi:gliding motility-associated-like protein